MKSYSKQQLADCAGVSVRTLMRWCQPYMEELTQLGFRPAMRIFPPRIVIFLADKFCIDVE